MNQRRLAIKNQRGIALAYTGIAIIAFVGLAALAMDTAHIALTANEVQVAADVAATSGAITFFRSPIATSGNVAAREGARLALERNAIDGIMASNWESDVRVGNYPTGTCSADAGGTGGAFMGLNAVTATITAEVPNLLTGIFGDEFRTSRVTRTATAAFQPSTGLPQLPMVVCWSAFTPNCFREECLPQRLIMQSNSTAWTAFDTVPITSTADVLAYLDESCGGTRTAGPIDLETSRIRLNNQFSPSEQQEILEKIECLVTAGLIELGKTEVTIPVAACPSGVLRETYRVVGFMSVILDEITPEGVSLHAVFDDTDPGPDGGCNFGRGYVKLVK